MLISIVKKLIGKNVSNDVPRRIYGAVVTQARNASFFSDLGIADTVMGRYDMLALHVFLVNRRLKYVETSDRLRASGLSQEIFDLFVVDLERGLRDLGYADTGVHKRKKRLARSYYALIEEFGEALEADNCGNLTHAIGSRYFDKFSESEKLSYASLLEAYMFHAVSFLAQQSFLDIVSGEINWPAISVKSVEY